MEPQLVPIVFKEITKFIVATSFEGLILECRKSYGIPLNSQIEFYDCNNGAEITDDIFEMYIKQFKTSPLFKIQAISTVCLKHIF